MLLAEHRVQTHLLYSTSIKNLRTHINRNRYILNVIVNFPKMQIILAQVGTNQTYFTVQKRLLNI